ncbi:Nucleotidyl transferase [Desulfofarcimen acetoxidans DSM 771]|uniref:Glucose-1-phosphate thymidylyltransferase n=1 Tax=Desulfofarcimen acetoxidans (strain ATCC 49208 / DSM 771 / KCTC 5769 / VKM B-1644 / 5575) TaxID=485916 RepID=C8VYT8_DESAS|nr:sugar phosphate nucleotidyltransferase [Desulfofarcimen acetoxidans]ACV64809.1 Nucleotidyl transferase [Desulfofarcimen acetoxidans DSM 771]
MKGIILAGGTGSRLFPLTKVTNKHLLPVGKYPMIYYPISKLAEADISDILIVTGKEHMGDVVNLLGSGKQMRLSFTYRVQDEAGGIAQALGLAEEFAKGNRCVVILGDNIFYDSISPYVEAFKKQQSGARLLLKEVHDPQRYGVAEINEGRIIGIVEKPTQPKSNYAVTGVYMFDEQVFEMIKTIKPSHRGEMEITDVNNIYIQRGSLCFDVLKEWWTDAGTFNSLSMANKQAIEYNLDNQISKILGEPAAGM